MYFLKLLLTLSLLYTFSLPVFAIDYIEDAKQYLAKDEYHAAIIQLKNQLKNSPKDANARHILGVTYSQTGEYLQAEKELKRAVQLAPENQAIQFDYAQTLLTLRKYKKVISLLEEKYSKPELEQERLNTIASAKLALDQVADAKSIFEQLINENYSNALIGLARIAYIEDEYQQAKKLVDTFIAKNKEHYTALKLKGKIILTLKEYPQALEIYNSLLTKNENDTDILLQRAMTYMYLKQFPNAEEDVNVVLKINENHLKANYLIALVYLNQNKYKEAQKHAQKIYDAIPEHSVAIYILGLTHFQLENYNQAEKYLIQYLLFQPESFKAKIFLARIYAKKDQPKEVIEILSELKKDHPDNFQLLTALGQAYMIIGEHPQGLELLKQANSLAPKSKNTQKSMILGHFKTGDMSSGIKALEAYTPTKQNAMNFKLTLVSSYIKNKQLKKAEQNLDNLIKDNPNNPDLYVLRAELEKARQNTVAEEKAYHQALKSDKNFIFAYLGLAQLNEKKGDFEKAKQQYQKVLSINSKHKLAPLKLALIAEQIDKNTNLAEKYLMDAYKENKKDIDKRLLFAIALVKFYERNKQDQRMKSIANNFLKSNPDSLEALSLMANVYIMQGDQRQAEVFLKKVIVKNPKDIKHRLILAELLAQDPEREANLNQVLEDISYIAPSASQEQILNIKANFYVKNKNYEKALQTVQELKDLFPFSNESDELKADILWQMGQLEQALSSYQEAYKKESSDSLASKITTTLMNLNKSDIALTFLQEQLKKQESNETLMLKLAQVHLKRTEFIQAIWYYQKLLEQQPDNLAVANNLAWLYAQTENDRAEGLAQKTYNKQPNSADIADTYGYILLVNKKNKKALDILSKAQQLSPDNHGISFHLAQAYNANGDKEKAILLLETITNSSIKFSTREQALMLLKRLKTL